MNEEEYYEGDEQPMFKKAAEDTMYPVTNQEQLGQDILRTFARTADPDTIEFRKIKRTFPVIVKKILIDEKGKEREVDVIDRWEEKEWEIPIRIQPKYPEFITDDISRAFLDDVDLAIYRDYGMLGRMIKSFADKYELDLAPHYTNIRNDAMLLITSSGAYKGQRVKLAKSNIAETVYRANMFQATEQRKQKKKKSFLGLF